MPPGHDERSFRALPAAVVTATDDIPAPRQPPMPELVVKASGCRHGTTSDVAAAFDRA